jgi:uncharacterized surface protein with fasciclin (FAS1) repeats
MDGMVVATINGKDVTVTINDDGVFINDAKVTMADIEADNGVVHVIDAVLLPPDDETEDDTVILDFEAPETSTLFQYFGSSIDGTLNEVIANPNPTGVNTSDSVAVHLRPAGSETFAGAFSNPGPAMMIAATAGGQVCMDVHMDHIGSVGFKLENGDGAQNWTIFKENTVVNDWETLCFSFDSPSEDQTTIAAAGNTYSTIVLFFDFGTVGDSDQTNYFDNVVVKAGEVVETTTIVDIVVNSEVHTILETAVLAAGLETTLSGPGPFTLFAPSDDAFANLPAGVLDAVLADPEGLLTDILLYHALDSDVRSADLSDGMVVATINGKDITVTINDDGVFINDVAQVTMADIVADNGVVHVINAVLLPPADPETGGVIVDFEAPETSTYFQYFGSSLEPELTGIIANPNPTGVNTSDSVGVYVKAANSQTWAGAFSNPNPTVEIDATAGGEVCVDVHMDHIGNLTLKLENGDGAQNWITTVENTVVNDWETLCYDLDAIAIEDPMIPATGNVYKTVVLFFDFGSNDVVDVTSYFDNIVYKEPTSSVEGKTIPVQEFTLTPNATNLYTTLKWSDQSDKIISIIDSNGRLLESMRASKYENEKVINVRNFPAGVYFIKLDSATKSGVQRLIVGK